MKILKYSQTRNSTTTITVANESLIYPKKNLYSEPLIEKTLVDSTVKIHNAENFYENLVAIYAPNLTGITIMKSSSDSWAPPSWSSAMTKWGNWYYAEIPVAYRGPSYPYMLITPASSGDKYIHTLLIGQSAILSGMALGSYPEQSKQDIVNKSIGGQIYKTPGVSTTSTSYSFESIEYGTYNGLNTWYVSADSSYNTFIFPFEEDNTYSPYYGNISSLSISARDKYHVDYKLKIDEVN